LTFQSVGKRAKGRTGIAQATVSRLRRVYLRMHLKGREPVDAEGTLVGPPSAMQCRQGGTKTGMHVVRVL